MQKTPLESWLAQKIGLPAGNELRLEALKAYQLNMLRQTLDLCYKASPFYARHLKNIDFNNIKSLADISALPFIYPSDLAEHGLQMLCVSQSQIARVVTLQTSGTTASPKRLYFTMEDLELTADFFAHGIQALVSPGQRLMALMPGPNIGSVGERLAAGLNRINCETLVYGFVQNPDEIMQTVINQGIDSLVGLPVQVLSLVRCGIKPPEGQIKSVLLSADYVPDSIIQAISQAWNCPVFNHYGLTETGLGGGVECQALSGCHLREADLLLEIVDSQGNPVSDGQWGEVVLTTLTRVGMPLIRYRTGDISRFLTDTCACGSSLKRLDKVRGRSIYNLSGSQIRLDELDEAIFTLPDILDFAVTIHPQKQLLDIEFWTNSGGSQINNIKEQIHQSLCSIKNISQLLDQKKIDINIFMSSKPLFSGHPKRKIKKEEYAADS